MQKKGLWISPSTFVEFAQSRKSLSQEIATRERSIDFYSLGMYLPNPDPVLKKLGKDISVYRDLMVDARVGAGADSRRSGVTSLLWAIDKGKAKSRQAQLIEDLFADLDMNRIISELLEGALYGYSPAEILWQPLGGLVLPSDIVGKPPEWFVYGDDNRLRFRTRSSWTGEDIPDRKFVVARRNPTYANPYGDPALAACFWPVTFKKGGLKFWVTFAEKYGMPYLMGKHRSGASQQEKTTMLDMMERMIQDGLAVIPDNTSLEFVEHSSGTTSSQLYKGLVEYCNDEIATALLGQTLTTGTGGGGSYALGLVHAQVRKDIVDADKQMVTSAINQVIRWIIEINFGSSFAAPVFDLYAEEDVDQALAERDNKLSNTGQIKFTKTYFMRNYGFAEDEIEVVDPKPAQALAPEFSAADPRNPEQEAVDALAAGIPAELMQAQIEQLLAPVIDLVESASSFEDVKAGVAALFPKLNSSDIQSLIEKAMLLSEAWGRSNARTE